jgi:hypothetical protein
LKCNPGESSGWQAVSRSTGYGSDFSVMRRHLSELLEMGQNIDRCGAGKVINRAECTVDFFTDLKKAGGVLEMMIILIISQIPENGNTNRLQSPDESHFNRFNA